MKKQFKKWFPGSPIYYLGLAITMVGLHGAPLWAQILFVGVATMFLGIMKQIVTWLKEDPEA